MGGRWWRWLSALLAVLCGLAFGWVAGTDIARGGGAQAQRAGAALVAEAGHRGLAPQTASPVQRPESAVFAAAAAAVCRGDLP